MKLCRIILALAISLTGCSLLERDLIDDGTYLLDVANNGGGCEVVATAKVREEKLYLSGYIRPFQIDTPMEGSVEIRFKTPDGVQKSEGRVPIRLENHLRTSHSHAKFEVVIDRVPPPRTVIKIIVNFPLCSAEISDVAGMCPKNTGST